MARRRSARRRRTSRLRSVCPAALQHGASNSNTPVRVDSKGDGGRVSQSNSVDSDATALNVNLTKQDADQDQGGRSKECGCQDGTGIQAIGQEAKSEQGALAASLAAQSGGHDRCGCDSSGNTNAPVRVDSYGDGGSVAQSNSVDSDATAANLNALKQDADQDQSGSGGIQAIGQEAKNEQAAIGLSAALQHGASNSNTPVRVDSKGDGGRVSQSNSVDSDATALNVNLTKQDADQDQGGRSKECGCQDGIGIQAIGQEAKSEQGALAASLAAQAGASNENAPVGVDSYGRRRVRRPVEQRRLRCHGCQPERAEAGRGSGAGAAAAGSPSRRSASRRRTSRQQSGSRRRCSSAPRTATLRLRSTATATRVARTIARPTAGTSRSRTASSRMRRR